MNKKFYKIKITFEILSEEPISSDMSIDDIYIEAINGEYSMNEGTRKETILNSKQAANALRKQGSDPSFFELTNDWRDE